jgi:hypothetical protein
MDQSRQYDRVAATSGLAQRADILVTGRHVANLHMNGPQQIALIFDHLVGVGV